MTLHRALATPDMPHCPCDGAKPGALLPVDTALARAFALLPPVTGSETVPLGASAGRVTAVAIRSAVPLPLFDNAAMDGYGLDPAMLVGPGPWVLPVAGAARAGDAPVSCAPGMAVRILTGAAVPPGVTAIVPQEEVLRDGNRIELRRRPTPGAHIRRTGSDLAAGAVILPEGRPIGPREIGALAGSGQAQVAVRPRLRVAILSTGSELVEPGNPLSPGQIWNVNRALLLAALAQPWITTVDLGAIPDNPDSLLAALASVADGVDLIVTTGGVSVGDEDHMARVIGRLGGTIHAMKLAMKPGKPVTIGTLGGAIWLGLPGNPVASFVTWAVLGAPIARAMAGLADVDPPRTMARLATGVAHRPGRAEYRPACLRGHDAQGTLIVDCLDDPGSHRFAQLACAEGLALIPAEAEAMPAGALVTFLPF